MDSSPLYCRVNKLNKSVVTTKLADKNAEKRKALAAGEYEILQKLAELERNYFWLASNELHNKETDSSTIKAISDTALELSNLVYVYEESEFTKELLKILNDESYETYNKKWKHILDLMGSKIRPTYKKYIKELNDNNIALMAQDGFVAKAPASGRFRMGV